MVSRLNITPSSDAAALATSLGKIDKKASFIRTSNAGSAFYPDGGTNEDGSPAGTGVVVGPQASAVGGIGLVNKNGELEPLVDTDAITSEVNEAKQNAQDAVDAAVGAIASANAAAQAAGAANDVANAANANSTEAQSVATQAAATANSAAQSATSAQNAAKLALANAQNMVMNTGSNLDNTWQNKGVTAENGVYTRTFPGNEYHVDFLWGGLSGKAIRGHTYSISLDARVDSGDYVSDDYFRFGWSDGWFSVKAQGLSSDWQRFAANTTVLGNGTDAPQFFMSSYMNSDGAKVVQFRNLSIKDITEAQAAQMAADKAQSTADSASSVATQANATAVSANQSATSAQTAANLALANSQEFVVNGGFETGDLTGWTASGVAVVRGMDQEYPHSGNYQARFAAGASCSQLINGLVSGHIIRCSFWQRGYDNRTATMTISFNGGTEQTVGSIIGVTPYTRAFKDFTVPANTTMATIKLTCDTNYIRFDDISVKDITEAKAAQSTADTAQATADAAKSIAETNATDLTSFINETTDNLSSLQSQVDGSITTWFYDVAPTTSNKPASDWTTTDLKNNHLGDLYYDTDTGYCYRWQVASNTYSWSRISDVDVTKALSDAATAQDTADSKRRVFTGTPTTPYDVGDLWVQGASGDIFTCSTAKTSSQSYNASDWKLASKYTDDTLANQANQSAATALTNANQALARATHVTTGPTAPTQNVETGDVWFPTNTAGNVIGMKTWGGSAWTDVQLLAGSILVPGSVGATVIADGAITTPKLTANAITSEKIAAGAVDAGKIAANSITTNELNVGDITNLQDNPKFERELESWVTSGETVVIDQDKDRHEKTRNIAIFVNASDDVPTAIYGANPVPAEPEDAFLIDIWAAFNGATTRGIVLVGLHCDMADGTVLNTQDYMASVSDISAQWSRLLVKPVVPENAISASPYIALIASTPQDRFVVSDVRMLRATNAELFVNGAIDGQEITGVVVNGSTINGGTINGTNLQTSESGFRVKINQEADAGVSGVESTAGQIVFNRDDDEIGAMRLITIQNGAVLSYQITMGDNQGIEFNQHEIAQGELVSETRISDQEKIILASDRLETSQFNTTIRGMPYPVTGLGAAAANNPAGHYEMALSSVSQSEYPTFNGHLGVDYSLMNAGLPVMRIPADGYYQVWGHVNVNTSAEQGFWVGVYRGGSWTNKGAATFSKAGWNEFSTAPNVLYLHAGDGITIRSDNGVVAWGGGSGRGWIQAMIIA